MKKPVTSRWDAAKFVEILKQKGVSDDGFLAEVKWAVETLSYLAHLATDLDPSAIEPLKEADAILGLKDTYEDK